MNAGLFNFAYKGKEYYLKGLEPYILTTTQEKLGNIVFGYYDFKRTDNLDVRVLSVTKIYKTKKDASEGIRIFGYVYLDDLQFIFEMK